MIPKVIDQARRVIESPVTPSPSNDVTDPSSDNLVARARRNFFRATPTASQASVVGASPVGSPVPTVAPVARPAVPPVTPTPSLDVTSPTSGVDYINSLYTSPDEELRMRKASVQRQRVLAVADALRHIGNIYNTSRYAPVQKFNNPAEEERTRYLQEKQLRDANNFKVLTYQQAKAKQDAQMAQYEAEAKRKAEELLLKKGYNEAQIRDMELRRADARAYNEAILQIRRDAEAERRRVNDERLRQGDERIAISRTKGTGSRGGGGRRGGGMSEYDVDEERTKRTNPDGSTTWTSKKRRRSATGTTATMRTTTTTPAKRKNKLGL